MPDLMTELETKLRKAPIEDYMLGMVEELLSILRNDKVKLLKAIDQRKKQIASLTNDQEADKRTLGKVEGGLSVAVSLTSKYRVKHQAHKRKLEAAKKKSTRAKKKKR